MSNLGPRPLHYLFCLRHFNDIDNIAPAIHFLLERRTVRVTVLVYSLDYDYGADPALNFLQRTWGGKLRVVWIGSLAGYSASLITRPRVRRWHYRLRRLLRRPVLELAIGRAEQSGLMQGWLEPLFEDWGQPASVVFDQNRSSVIAGLLTALRAIGVERIVSLPVSPWVNINVLRQIDFIRVDARVFWKKHDYDGFDAIGQVDPYYRDSLEGFFKILDHPSPFQGRERILGAIRFTDEWLSVRRTYAVKTVPDERMPPMVAGRRRLLVLPSHRKNNSFWEEYLRTLHFLAQFDEYDIVVKPHTRYGDGYDDLPEDIRLAPEPDTSALIDWSEIILFWGSSVALEGFQKDRVMVCLDYLNGNRSVFAVLEAGHQCRCRDELLRVLRDEDTMREAREASTRGKDRLRSSVIEGGQGSGVIERYLDFCEGSGT